MPKLPDLPMPRVEGLNEYDEYWLDLNPGPFVGWVYYEGMAPGEAVNVYFYGCGPEGQVSDFAILDELDEDNYDPRLGYQISFNRGLLGPIDNGRAFFSYVVDQGLIGERISPRRFFYVGTRATRPEVELPVTDLWPSHNLEIDFYSLPTSLQVLVMPYASQAVGDRVVVHWGVYENGQAPVLRQYQKVVAAADVGRPLAIPVPRGHLSTALGKDSRVYYQVHHVGPDAVESTSITQHFDVVERPASEPLLAPPTVVGYPDETVFDPAQFPNGMPIEVPFSTTMRSGDWVLLEVTGSSLANSLRLHLRLDPSNIATKSVRLLVPQLLLTVNVGAPITFSYHHSRRDVSLGSEALRANVRRPLNMPLVQIPKANPDGSASQYRLDASLVSSGAQVVLPEAFNPPTGTTVAVHWEGELTQGRVVLDQHAPNFPKVYNVPSRYIPSNFGQPFKVYYTATEPNQSVQKSAELSLRILAPTIDAWPVLQCARMHPNGDLLLSENANGTELTLARWLFISTANQLRVVLTGLRASNGAAFSETLLDRRVEVPELVAGVRLALSREKLEMLQLGAPFSLLTRVSFDSGKTFIDFTTVRGRLVS
ncbi:hypothetical protein [Pseudomonas sp. nanlin1]|uniref:hypothetical protein n=1 Tax=Pseudomonas sp. nanlin1 TaxID=3040605 RepID=UPI00388F9941